MVSNDPANERRIATERMGPERRQRLIGVCGVDDRDELSLIGDMQRIEAEHLTRGADLVAKRNRHLIESVPFPDAAAIP